MVWTRYSCHFKRKIKKKKAQKKEVKSAVDNSTSPYTKDKKDGKGKKLKRWYKVYDVLS